VSASTCNVRARACASVCALIVAPLNCSQVAGVAAPPLSTQNEGVGAGEVDTADLASACVPSVVWFQTCSQISPGK
jgi:hypothetical protein